MTSLRTYFFILATFIYSVAQADVGSKTLDRFTRAVTAPADGLEVLADAKKLANGSAGLERLWAGDSATAESSLTVAVELEPLEKRADLAPRVKADLRLEDSSVIVRSLDLFGGTKYEGGARLTFGDELVSTSIPLSFGRTFIGFALPPGRVVPAPLSEITAHGVILCVAQADLPGEVRRKLEDVGAVATLVPQLKSARFFAKGNGSARIASGVLPGLVQVRFNATPNLPQPEEAQRSEEGSAPSVRHKYYPLPEGDVDARVPDSGAVEAAFTTDVLMRSGGGNERRLIRKTVFSVARLVSPDGAKNSVEALVNSRYPQTFKGSALACWGAIVDVSEVVSYKRELVP